MKKPRLTNKSLLQKFRLEIFSTYQSILDYLPCLMHSPKNQKSSSFNSRPYQTCLNIVSKRFSRKVPRKGSPERFPRKVLRKGSQLGCEPASSLDTGTERVSERSPQKGSRKIPQVLGKDQKNKR